MLRIEWRGTFVKGDMVRTIERKFIAVDSEDMECRITIAIQAQLTEGWQFREGRIMDMYSVDPVRKK